ncbi:MAG TPA: hypothetical protein VFV40_08880 [Nocardioides sp.]|nr:hypothetical protein [Nocardioides sp.]
MALIRHRNRDTEHDQQHDHPADTVHDGRHVADRDDQRTVIEAGHDPAREKFGGVNLGAAVFGWLVAVAVAVILTSVLGALVAAVGSEVQISQSEAEREAGTLGLAAAVVLVAVLLIAYYTGGYVAGRMSRFDGAKQGVAVWGIGLLVTLAAVVLGAVFGSQYNILDRVSLPRIPVPTESLTAAGLVTAGVLVIGTLLAAMLGGKVGNRYHTRVDRVAVRGR